MFVNIPKLGNAHLYAYQYDQLNRIVSMDAFKGFDNNSNAWATTAEATKNYKERISYDANGNILSYLRNGTTAGGAMQQMDSMIYQYPKDANSNIMNNRLRYVQEEIAATNYKEDIDNQTTLTRDQVIAEILPEQAADNYAYDAIGNLIKDTKEGITNITWNVYGKIESITKATGIISYTYDASGNRISKTFNNKSTWYVRDASGNTMSTYITDAAINSGHLTQSEIHLYGSSRLGILNTNTDMQVPVNTNGITTFIRGNKFFELNNHLGNVLATISDKKIGIDDNNDDIIDYWKADILTAKGYYPFGMLMPDSAYRKELSPDHSGSYYMTGATDMTLGQNSITEAPNNFTIEFWAKPTATHEIDSEGDLYGGVTGQRYVIAPSWYAAPSEAGMGVSMGTNGISVYEHAAGYMPPLLVWQSPTPITDWVHVAVVYEDNVPYLYINGLLVHTGQQSSRQLVYPSFNFTGYDYGSYQGYVDEMRIWSEVRTQQQIADNRYGPIPSPQTNLSGYWPVDAANPGVLLDLSGNGRDVTMMSTTGNSSDHVMGGNGYRYGFNGQEKSDDVTQGNYTAQYWEYDSRIGRRWNIDPVIKDYESPYMTFSGNPILFNDPDGDDPDKPKDKGTKEGQVQKTTETTYASLHNAPKTTTIKWFWHEGGVQQDLGKPSVEGWYTTSEYSKVLTPVARDLAGYMGIHSAGTGGHNWTAEEKQNVANTKLGQFVGTGLSADAAQVLASSAQSNARNRGYQVLGITYQSGFNVEDMIGVGLIAKELAKGLGKFVLSKLPQGGVSFSEYKVLKGGTQTLDFIETTNKQGQVVFQRISTEFSHKIITQRTQKAMGLPNWLVNNKINVWKLNTIQHSLIDPARRQFLRAGMKSKIGFFGNMQYNWFTKFPIR